MTVLTSILHSVASSTERTPLELPPLYDTIDPEVIANFVDSVSDESAALDFSYCGCNVLVKASGDVVVRQEYSQNIYN